MAWLWDEDPPPAARKSLQAYLSRLRNRLGPGAVRSRGHAYALAAHPADVDAGQAEGLIDEARRLMRSGANNRAAAAFAEALERWSGAPLCDVPATAAVRAAVVRLEELRRDAEEDLFDAQLAGGAPPGTLVANLEASVAAEPLRERRWAQLMTALTLAGRAGDALRAFQRARVTLGDVLGIEPGVELRALERRILAGGVGPGGDDGGPAAAGGRAPPPTQGFLPKPRSAFLGREAELVQLRGMLDEHRLLTVTGPGGAGKTRVALELVGGLGEPSAFVDLAPLSDGARVPLAFAGAFGLDVGSGGDPWAQVKRALGQAGGLVVVVDNCEHVVADVARCVDDLLDATELRVVATSRVPLGLPDECRYPLPALSQQVSNALFMQRAAQAGATSLDAAEVALLVAGLDGLPLAIELLAARTRTFTPRQLLEMHDDVVLSLEGSGHRRAPRQRTLEAAIRWSYDLLDDHLQSILRGLSIMPGWFRLADVAPVCGLTEAQAVAAVQALESHSLLVPERRDGSPGFRLLDAIRSFGRGALLANDEHANAMDRFVALVLGRIERRPLADALMNLDWGEEILSRRADLLQALGWAMEHDRVVAARLLRGVGPRFIFGYGSDVVDALQALSTDPGVPVELRATLNLVLSVLMQRTSRGRATLGPMELAESLLTPDHPLAVAAPAFSAMYASLIFEPPDVEPRLRRALDALAGSQAGDLATGLAHTGIGATWVMLGDPTAAIEHFEQARAVDPPPGATLVGVTSHCMRLQALCLAGRAAEALAYESDYLDAAAKTDWWITLGAARAAVLIATGRLEAATSILIDAISDIERRGMWTEGDDVVLSLGLLAEARGDRTRARALAEAMGVGRTACSMCLRAQLLERLGDPPAGPARARRLAAEGAGPRWQDPEGTQRRQLELLRTEMRQLLRNGLLGAELVAEDLEGGVDVGL